MEENTLKLKRQVRDHYNKSVKDKNTIERVAEVIGYGKDSNDNSSEQGKDRGSGC